MTKKFYKYCPDIVELRQGNMFYINKTTGSKQKKDTKSILIYNMPHSPSEIVPLLALMNSNYTM